MLIAFRQESLIEFAGIRSIGSCVITATSGARQKDAAFTTSNTLRGNLTSTYRYGSGSWLSGNPSTWAWRLYDDTGNVLKTKNPQGVIGTTVEDSSKNFAVPSSITVAGLSTTMNWNSALGLTSASRANGESSGTVYDSYARPSSTTSPTGQTTTFTYAGNVTTATTNGRFVRTTVDGFGRPLLTESGYGTTVVSVVENEYQP